MLAPLALSLLFPVACPGVARAHTLTAGQVIARVGAADSVEAFGVVSVERSADLDRLLIVRVGKGWQEADPELRRTVSEKWLHMWRAATRNGVVAVINATGGTSLVGYDADGRATLTNPPPP